MSQADMTWEEVAYMTLVYSLLTVLIAGWLTLALAWRGVI